MTKPAPLMVLAAWRGAAVPSGEGAEQSDTGYVGHASLDCWTRYKYRRLSGTSRGEAHVSACGFGHGFSDVSGRCRLDECLVARSGRGLAHGCRVFLYAANQSRATEALVELTQANTRRVTLVWTTEVGAEPPLRVRCARNLLRRGRRSRDTRPQLTSCIHSMLSRLSHIFQCLTKWRSGPRAD